MKRVTGGGEQKHSWDEAALRYGEEVLPTNVKENTATRYRVSIKGLTSHFRQIYIEDITRKTIAEFISGRRAAGKPLTNATIRRDLTALSGLLKACVSWGWRDDNPARDFDRSTVAERRLPRVLPTDEQVDAVEARLTGNLKRLWRFLLQSGMREEEAAGLKHSQVKPGRGAELSRTKTGRLRIVPFDDPLLRPAVITIGSTTRHLRCEHVFWHETTWWEGPKLQRGADRYHNVSSRLSRAIKALGYGFTGHDLRHRFAVDYLKRGGNIYNLQQILGHSSLKTTEIYLDYLTPEEQHRAKYGDHKRERNRTGLGREHSAANPENS